jgi:ferritin
VSTPNETVQATVTLPKDVYSRIAHAARDEDKSIDEFMSALVAEGINAHASLRELFEKVSALYRARLEREGKLHQSPDEVMQELGSLREQIASELYPNGHP